MYELKINSVLLDEKGEKFFGSGPLQLLEGVRKYGSLSAAAKAMDMSYSKANKLIRHAQDALGFPLLKTYSGGKAGGYSSLSKKGEVFLSLYEDYALVNRNYGKSHLNDLQLFEEKPDVGIIILASGKGERFKENKLLYKINDRPLISYILETLLPLKENCVLSTIEKKIAEIGEKRGYKIALHEDESLSASIRSGLSLLKPGPLIFVQADQPLLSLTSIMKLISAYHQDPDRFYKLSYNGRKAAPTLFPGKYYKELEKLTGEEGGSTVIRNNPESETVGVEALFPWEIWDLDYQEDLGYFEDLLSYLGKEKQ